jgi:redox-sensitive bicupin YhaK (pirin superfamily)
MTDPVYFDIKRSMIPVVQEGGSEVRVISGAYGTTQGVVPGFVKATLYDVSVKAGDSISIPTKPAENVFVFLIEGDAEIGGGTVKEKAAVLFGEGSLIKVGAAAGRPLRFIFFSGPRLREPVAWGGPIVMNTREELEATFQELRNNTFIKHAGVNRQ